MSFARIVSPVSVSVLGRLLTLLKARVSSLGQCNSQAAMSLKVQFVFIKRYFNPGNEAWIGFLSFS